MKVIINIPNIIYEENEKKIEKIIERCDEDLGRISEIINTSYESGGSEFGYEDDYAEVLAYEYIEDEENGKMVKDMEIIKKIDSYITDKYYYGNFWHKTHGGYATVKSLAVVDLDDKYRVFSVVEHGIQDEDGKKSYTDITYAHIDKKIEKTLDWGQC